MGYKIHLRQSEVCQFAGPIQHQNSIEIGKHCLVVETQIALMSPVGLGNGLTRLLPGTTTENQHDSAQNDGKCEKTQSELPYSLSPILHSHYAFHHFPFIIVIANSRAVFLTIRAGSFALRVGAIAQNLP